MGRAVYSLASAVFYALYIIATRVLSRTDTSETTLFYSNLVGAVAMLPVLPFVWTMPDSPWSSVPDGGRSAPSAASGITC